MAEEFTSAIQRCGLPLKLDEATQGDGNCWVRAVVQQLERPEMRQQLNNRTREILNVRKSERHLVLKSRIAEFATTSRHPNILDIKETFRTEGQGQADNISWEDHWRSLKKDKEWSDEVMVQATAWFTEMDIQLVMTTGMPEEPFKMIGGNMDDRIKDCPGFPMWIGYKNNIHYQSLLPNDDEVPYPRSCRSKNEQEAQYRHSHKEEQPGDKIPKKTSEENKKPGDKILNSNEQNATEHRDEEDQQESSQKRKYQCESNESAKVIKSGESEAFLFKEGNRVYRCVAEPEGYQCCMCPNVFSQIGRHISSSKCGETLDVKRFTAELKKYLDAKKKAKNRAKKLAENSAEYRHKDAQRKKEAREKKMAQDSKECRQKEAKKEKKSREKRVKQDSKGV